MKDEEFKKKREPSPVKMPRSLVEWEDLAFHGMSKTSRLPVPGGWLYKVELMNGFAGTVTMIFVPDPVIIEQG